MTVIGAVFGQTLISWPLENFFGFNAISFFLAGMIATVAWILPGLSGSLMLFDSWSLSLSY